MLLFQNVRSRESIEAPAQSYLCIRGKRLCPARFLNTNTHLSHTQWHTINKRRKLPEVWPFPHHPRPLPVTSRHAPVWSLLSPLAGCLPPSSAKWLQWHGGGQKNEHKCIQPKQTAMNTAQNSTELEYTSKQRPGLPSNWNTKPLVNRSI